MFTLNKQTYVDDEIQKVTREMNDMDPKTKEYSDALDKLGKLQKIREDEKPDSISRNTLFTGAVQVLVIGIIVRHEHLNVITSKAMSFVPKMR